MDERDAEQSPDTGKRSAFKRWALGLLLLGFGMGLGLLVAELAVRYALPPELAGVDHVTAGDEILPLHEYLPDDPLGWKLAPHRNRGLYQTNSLGFRDRERAIPRPADCRRILFLGDSIVFGSGLPSSATLPSRLEALLSGSTEVLNLGVSGYNSQQEAELLERNLDRLQPNLVLLGYCANDAGPQPILVPRADGGWDHLYYTSPDMPATLPLAQPLDRWLSLHSHLYRFLNLLIFRAQAGRQAADTRFQRISHLQRDQGLSRIQQQADRAGVPLLAIAFPFFPDPGQPDRERLHRDGLSALHQLSIPTLDLAAVYQQYETELLKLTPSDPLHLSPAGTAVISKVIANWLQEQPGFQSAITTPRP